MGWTRIGPPVSGLPSIDSLCFGAHLRNGDIMRVRYLLTATWFLSLFVAAPFHARALEDRPVPPLPIPNVANTTVHPSAVSSPPQSRPRPRDHAQRTAAPPAGEKSAIKAGQASGLKSGEASDLSTGSTVSKRSRALASPGKGPAPVPIND